MQLATVTLVSVGNNQQLVAMAAVHAMATGRKHMWSRSVMGAEDPQACVQAGCAQAKSAFWLSLHNLPLYVDTRHVRAGMFWVPRILFCMSLASPHAYMFGYLALALLFLCALDACLDLLLLFLLGCRQLCPVLACGGSYACLRSF
jgi:hypothetical protein